MAGSSIIRTWLDLIEAIQNPWTIDPTDLFNESFRAMLTRVPDLRDRLKRFADIKLPNPISRDALVGKHDRPFTGLLVGYWHCHLAPDAVLIYRLKNHAVQLLLVCQHQDIEGKRAKAVLKTLANV
jgi:mRNA-degrading endonuclease YafQ of YafQ-DinJ toxin-antitoxin module